jgi:type VI secretion system VgrG family protein
MDEETFTVVSFKGVEAISRPYEFEVELVSEKNDVDPLDVLENTAKFTIHRDEGDSVDFNGILMQFEELREFHGYFFFRAVLAPKLWWLSLTHHNQVFLDKTIPEIIQAALEDGGLHSGIDFSFDVQQNYSPLEYVCQYDESHFDFVSRWAEREGIYYFFEQTPKGEKVVFTDSRIRHQSLPLGEKLRYDPPSGMASLHTDEIIQTFMCRHNMLPRRVYLKDYNYLKPSLAVEGIADVDDKGRGENYIYGVHFDSVEEGNRLAGIRADALKCRKSIFNGESTVPFLVPGYTFDLTRHYKSMYNRSYLLTEVSHQGHQTGYLISGLKDIIGTYDEEMFYVNTFTAIYSDAQFRPEHTIERPRISGTINAKIDAAASGEYAELDEHGRYKVILPFDRSGRFGGKASAWFRMMQPYAGENQGMHFPLHKGTEVLLTFIDGNPDRPVIAGAVPNPETSSPINSLNQTKSVIQSGRSPKDTSAGAGDARARSNSDASNYIAFNDLDNSENILIQSKDNDPAWSAWSRHGKNADDPDDTDAATSNDDNKPGTEKTVNATGLKFYTDEKMTFQANTGQETRVVGRSINTARDATLVTGHNLADLITTMETFAPSNVYGYDEGITLSESGDTPPNRFPEIFEVQPVPDACTDFEDYFENASYSETTTVVTNTANGPVTSQQTITYYFKNDYSGDLNDAWKSYWRYWVGTYKDNPQTTTNEECGTTTLPSFLDTKYKYNSLDYTHYQSTWNQALSDAWDQWIQDRQTAWKKWQPHLKEGHTRVSHRDTFNMQEGNIYDFGGYWNYNLGNSYAENHISQNGELNSDSWAKDLADKGGPAGANGPMTTIKCNDLDLAGDLTAPSFDGYWSIDGGDFHNSGASPAFSKSLDPGQTWVEKTFGGANYSYTKDTQDLNVTVNTAEESHIYGHAEYEYKYSKGKLVSKTASKGGHSEEWKYDRITGVILSHEKKDWLGVGGNVVSSSFSMGNKTSSEISLSGNQHFELSVAAKSKIGIGVAFDFELYANPAWKLSMVNDKMRLQGPGTKFDKEEALKAEIKSLMFEDSKLHLQSHGVKMEKKEIEAAKKQLSLEESYLFHV